MTAYDDIAKGDRGEPEPSAAVGVRAGGTAGLAGIAQSSALSRAARSATA